MSKCPHAVALGEMARGHKKEMTPAAINQRIEAAKKSVASRKAKADLLKARKKPLKTLVKII